eukprot:173584-Pyramimonas_sp.AAC.1
MKCSKDSFSKLMLPVPLQWSIPHFSSSSSVYWRCPSVRVPSALSSMSMLRYRSVPGADLLTIGCELVRQSFPSWSLKAITAESDPIIKKSSTYAST